MKVAGILGSPRRGGNTEILLDKALEGALSAGAKVKKIVLNELQFKSCQECGGCDKTGFCIIKDDMSLLYKRIESSDGMILASPIFFGSLSAQTKMMIDRFQCVWVAKHILKSAKAGMNAKKGIFLCVSASGRKDFFENARKIVRNFFATAFIDYAGELYQGGVETKGDIAQKESVLKKAFDLGYALVKGS